MVYYSKIAQNDLTDLFWGLLTWDKHPLEQDHVSSYLDDLQDICNRLDQLSYHAKAQLQLHKKFGDNVYKYRRNKNTTWYIIYDFDELNNIVYINHIMPNHTSSE